MSLLQEDRYPQGPVLIDGYYPATLAAVNKYTKVYDGKETPRLAWIFDVEAKESAVDDSIEIEDEAYVFHGHFEVAAHTGQKKSKQANSNWHKLSMSTIVPDDCKETDELIGTKCVVNVSSYESDDGLIKNTVEKVRPPKSSKKDEDFEADMADLPF